MTKRIAVFMMIAVFALASLAYARGNTAQHQKGRNGVLSGISQKLGLTDDQVQSIVAKVKEFHDQAKQIRQSTMTLDEKKSKIQALRQSTKESILSVLTAEQREKAEKMGLVERLLNPKPAMGLMRILAKLNLTEQQKTEIKELMTSNREQCQAIKNDTSLSTEAKQAKIQELRKENLEKIKGVLTADQLKQFEELMQNLPQHQGKRGAK